MTWRIPDSDRDHGDDNDDGDNGDNDDDDGDDSDEKEKGAGWGDMEDKEDSEQHFLEIISRKGKFRIEEFSSKIKQIHFWYFWENRFLWRNLYTCPWGKN